MAVARSGGAVARLLFCTTATGGAAGLASRRMAPRAGASSRRARSRVPHRLSLCAGGERLGVLTLDGELSVWHTGPLARHARRAEDAPSAAAAAGVSVTSIPDAPLIARAGEAGRAEQWVSVGWWDEYSVILCCRSGAVSVCSLPELTNLLGAQPEQFVTMPALSSAHSGRFFILEREVEHRRRPARRPARSRARGRRRAVRFGRGRAPPPRQSPLGLSAGSLDELLPRRVQSWRRAARDVPEQLFERGGAP